MPVQIGVILAFMLGVWVGIQWIRASRADRADKLVRTLLEQRETIANLREELGEQRRSDLYEWLFEDEPEA